MAGHAGLDAAEWMQTDDHMKAQWLAKRPDPAACFVPGSVVYFAPEQERGKERVKQKGYKILISVLALGFSTLSACMGFGFMGNLPFSVRFPCGFVFLMAPLSVVWLLLVLWRK